MKEVRPEDLVSAIPLDVKPKTMTRKEKLLHWASLVRQSPVLLHLMHALEYYTPDQLKAPAYYVDGFTAFGLAMADPTFNELGLVPMAPVDTRGPVGSIRQAMDFFELTQHQLHAFSCNCGGPIANSDMASRIEHIANGS